MNSKNLSKWTRAKLIAEIQKLEFVIKELQDEFHEQEHDFQVKLREAKCDIRYEDLVSYIREHSGIDAIAEAVIEAGMPPALADKSDEELYWQTVLNLRRLAYLMLLGS